MILSYEWSVDDPSAEITPKNIGLVLQPEHKHMTEKKENYMASSNRLLTMKK
jgi:hypothetical protein